MAKSLKTSYSIIHQVESFFTGTQIIFDPAGEHFYCANGHIINKVSIIDGQVKAQISSESENDAIIQFTLSPEGALMVVAYNSGLIVKFNLEDNSIEREFKSIHTAPISQLKINPSGTLLATGSSDGTIKLWNLKNHYCSHNLKGVNGLISCIEFREHSDGNLLFCSAGDDNIHVFDIESSKHLTKLTNHCSTITDMKFSPSGDRLISIGRDKIAIIWDISRGVEKQFGKPIRTIPIYESIESIVILDIDSLGDILDQTIERDRVIFATIGESGVIKFWDSKTGSKIFVQNELPLSADRSPGSQCFQLCARPSHNQLCAVSAERDIFLYDLPHLKLVQQLQGHIDEILSACWFFNDKYVAMACNSNDLKIVELGTSKTHHLKGHTDIILCVKAVESDPMCIITSSKDCTILVWEFDPSDMSSIIVYKATGHTHAIHAIGVLGGEKTLFSGGEDTTLKKWSFNMSREPNIKTTNFEPVSLVAISTIKAHEGRIDSIAISPNDQLVATGSRDKTAKIFTIDGLKLLATLKGHRRGVYAVNFSPVDQVIVTASDVTLRMWNLQDFSCVKTFQGHECTVLNFTFLSEGLQLLSVGSDGNMKLWDCKTNECTKTIDGHSDNVWVLSPNHDDSLVITGGQDERLIVWRDTTKEEHEERLNNLQTQVVQEQDFMNYINRKKWRKAFKMALSMENQYKTLNVIREILLEPTGIDDLEQMLQKTPLDKLDFLIECCISWTSSVKSCSMAQEVLNIIIRSLDNEHLLKLTNLTNSIDHLKDLTGKRFDRFERLVQDATFVDFFLNSFRLQ